ncbi:putative membrane protein YfhO [Lacrimispora xylanisolvens]|uniref:Putative membrane protein YfhO n=1 Tax=Lacrimispora xylanisolvens TaxID=384636 RepID=A0A2S6HV10_9FIRM|nr:YfhO family protein [Hungatella xylanolytica]PPK81671.1 putative membrane protein YfhO [Hungatella xylanolytica]
MERDDDIEKISKELEDILKMTSDEKKDKTPDIQKKTDDRQDTGFLGDVGEEQPDYDSMPVIRLEVPVEGMEELYDFNDSDEDGESYPADEYVMTEEDGEEEIGEEIGEEEPFEEEHQEVLRSFRKKEHRSGSLVKDSDGLIAAFFVPVIIMIIIFAQRGIFPFGEESFLRTDMYHQYAPFFSEFQYKLTHGGSLLYSWDIGMGVNFAALYSYYLASPLNWLIVLCPKKFIIEFMTYMIVVKIGLSGLAFSWYLRRHFKTVDFGIAFFGIFYALSGYMAAYSWNIMWLDCILLFPLIMLGLEKLVQEKKCILYCITLGLSILSNYYISIMICIFMVFYFLALLILEGRKPWKEVLINGVHFAVYSLLAGGLAAVVLLPEIYAMKMTASGDINFPQTFSSYFSIFDMIARHLPAVETEIGLDHWPNIYCGVAILIFFLLYLGCRKIRQKDKIVMCSLLLFFYASFSINVFNFIWHGFHYPNSLPCRQSFIYIFLILTAGYHAYIYLHEIPWKHVVTAFFATVIFVIMAQKLITDDAFHFSIFYVAIIFLAVYTGLISLYQRGINRNVLVLLALGVVALEAAVNTTVTSVTTTSRTSYVKDNKASIDLTEGLLPNPDFYRVEKVTRKTKNDGAWMNFPSVSLFSSTANADLSKFFKKLGCESSTNAYSITGSTPLVDALFAVKYALYSEEAGENQVSSLVSVQDDMQLWKNNYALSLGFMMPYDVENNWQLELTNPAEVQNDLSVVLGASPVLSEVPSEVKGKSFTFTPDTDGDYYVFVSNKKVEKVAALLGEKTKNFDNVSRGYLLELGYLKSGEEVTLRNDDNDQDLIASAYRFVPEGLESVYQVLNKNSLKLTKWTDTQIKGTVDAEKAGLLYLSIPFDKGWSVKIDGKEAEPYKIFDTFLSVHMTAGTHEVSLEYMPEGLKAGGMITGGSILILLVLTGLAAGKNKKRKPMRTHTTN